MLYCMGLLGREGKWKYVMKKLCLYSVEDTNVFADSSCRQRLLHNMREAKERWPMNPKNPTTNFTDKCFEMIYDMCISPKSRLCDHAICASPAWLLKMEAKEEKQPRQVKPLRSAFSKALQEKDWKKALSLMCLYRVLFPKNTRDLWPLCPNGSSYLSLMDQNGGTDMWCQELLMVESILTVHEPWRQIRPANTLETRDKAAAKQFWDKLMTAPLDYEIRKWVDWTDWEDIVWDKHTVRGNGGDSVKSLSKRHPAVPPHLLAPDGPPIERTSKLEHFFDVGAFVPEPVIEDPFWLPGRRFMVQMENIGKSALEYVSETLNAGPFARSKKRHALDDGYLESLLAHSRKQRKVYLASPKPQNREVIVVD